mmetsp:Transcript_100099/g.291940  ORF Transcript_100099/g.291940 Transcript_100099/m.291940 type:complete len:277 (-) Transcript_100099:222-1052(-)
MVRWTSWLRCSEGKVSFYPVPVCDAVAASTRGCSSWSSLSCSSRRSGSSLSLLQCSSYPLARTSLSRSQTRLGSSVSHLFGCSASSLSNSRSRLASSLSQRSWDLSWSAMGSSLALSSFYASSLMRSSLSLMAPSVSTSVGCITQDQGMLRSAGDKSGDSILAAWICRAVYQSAGRRHLDAELRSCIRQDFDETSGDGDRIIQVLDAPLLTRRKAIRQYGEDSSLRTDAEQLFEILCRLIEPASTDFPSSLRYCMGYGEYLSCCGLATVKPMALLN